MIGVIRVFTAKDPEVVNSHGNKINSLYGIPVINRCIPEQPQGIHDAATELAAVPKIVALGIEMEEEGAELIVISCAADPGIKELREAVSIPVIGAGSAAALTALAIGKPVGIIGITEKPPIVMEEILGEKLVAYLVPEGVANTTDLMKPEGKEKGRQAVLTLLEQGAETIVFACTGFTTIGLADMLRKDMNIPIIDAVEAEGLISAYIVNSSFNRSGQGGLGVLL
ncbi:aspartate/glutamate racemase family protein [Niallia sp. MER 6]|uniref:aspartate/glutamate racemase family protein n=1 Tax=Niallia sp. MER 6 TaxID=2939567 RepID=UPI00203B098E|nr:aspartate/glutamate racemase family protein [Niallia sp. MER 6]MCM3032266.1 aspartate/glutamate racemase family protein [Niallia sp. MER 6]